MPHVMVHQQSSSMIVAMVVGPGVMTGLTARAGPPAAARARPMAPAVAAAVAATAPPGAAATGQLRSLLVSLANSPHSLQQIKNFPQFPL